MFININKILFSIALLLFYFQINTAFADEYSQIWDYDNASDYTISDTNSVSVSGNGYVELSNYHYIAKGKFSANYAYDVIVDGNYAYISTDATANQSYIYIIDVSDVSNPNQVASIKNGDTNNAITVNIDNEIKLLKDGNYLYALSYGTSSFYVIDVSNPVNPIVLSKTTYAGGDCGASSNCISFQNSGGGMDKQGNYVYITGRYTDGIVVLDVSNPTSPTLKGKITYGTTSNNDFNGTRTVKVRGNYAYLLSRINFRLLIIDISQCQSGGSTCDMFHISTSSTMGGEIYGIDIDSSGNYAYIANSTLNRLYVVDISNPYTPSIVTYFSDSSMIELSSVRNVFVDGNLLYISANTGNAISIFNISNPESPLFMMKISSNSNFNSPRGIFNSGNNLFIASGNSSNGGLQIYQLGYDNTVSYIVPNTSFSFNKNFLSLLESYGPENAGSTKYQISNDDGTTWYWFNGSSRVQTTGGDSQANPASVINKNLSLLNPIFGSGGNFKYKMFLISDGTQKVQVDMTVIVGAMPQNSQNDFTNPNNYIYSNLSLFYFNIRNEVELRLNLTPNTITPPSTLTDITNAYDVVVDGSYAYVSTYNGINSKIYIVDVSNPASPSVVTSINHNTTNNGINILISDATELLKDGNYLYAISYTSRTFLVIDVSNPTTPKVLAQLQSPATSGVTSSAVGYFYGASGIDKQGDYVYVSSRLYDGMTAIDVSNPSSPQVVGTINRGLASSVYFDGLWDVKVSGNYAFITARGYNRILVIDISNCKSGGTCSMSLVNSSINGLGEVYEIDVDKTGNYAYVVSTSLDSLYVIDISNPTGPSVVKTISDNGKYYDLNGARNIFVEGDYLYISAYDGGTISVADIKDPANPVFISTMKNSTYTLLNGARGIYKDGGYLYVASYGGNALQILKAQFDTNSPFLYPKFPIHYSNLTHIINGFSVELGKQNEGNVVFQISKDNGATWYYRDGMWKQAPTNYYEYANSAETINTHIFNFNLIPGGTGEFLFKAYFVSDGTQITSLKNVSVTFRELDFIPPTITINLPTSNQSLSVGQQINFDVSYSAFGISTINTTTFTGTLYKQNTTGSGTQTQNLFNPISLSVTSTGAFGTLSALPIGYYDLRFSIMDSSGNITHEVVTFYVSNHNSGTDQNAPVISYHFPVNEQIIPTGNFTISLNYSDDASGIDLGNSEFILGKWNEDKGDYDILEYDYLSQLNANSSGFSYNALDLSYGKYIYIAVILDYVLNSKVISVEFFIDEPEIIIGSPIYEFTVGEQHNTELLIFVKTVGAPYKLELYKDSPLVNSFGNIIIDGNGNNGIGYDSYPYTGLKNIPSIPIFTNETPTLNRTGKKSVYEHKLKFNGAVDELQAAGKYEMNISIKGFFSY